MPSLVETCSIFVLLVIGVLSMGGTNGNNQEPVLALNFKKALIAAKSQLTLEVQRGQGIKHEGQFQTNTQRSQGIKDEQQLPTYADETEGAKIEDLLQSYVTGKYQLLSEEQANKKLKIVLRFSTNAKKGAEITRGEQLQTSGKKSEKTHLEKQIRIKMREHQRKNVENDVTLLWKRGQGQSLEDRRPKSPPSMSSDYSASDTLPRINSKNKVARIFSNSYSKIKRVFSGGSQDRSNSHREGSPKYTSGYTKKPSVLGRIDENPPGPHLPSGAVQVADLDMYSERPSPVYPAKGPEVQQIWDFINSHSKKWSIPQDSPPKREEGEPSQPRRDGSPSKRKPQNAGQGSDSKEDKDNRHLIKRHHKGWATPEGLPAVDASSSSPEEEYPKQSHSPKSSPPRSPNRSPTRNLTSVNSLNGFKELTKKDLDNKYEAFLTRVRSNQSQQE